MNRSEAGRLGGLITAEVRKQKSIESYSKNPKRCKNCGKILPYEKRANTFCGICCRNVQRAAELLTEGEDANMTELKKSVIDKCKTYCSNACQQEFQYKDYIKQWKLGKVSGLSGKWGLSAYIRSYIHNKFNNSCSECGCSLVNPYTNKSILEIHHIDGNYLNNSEDNLTLLCPNCHAMTDTYKNIGSRIGRAKSFI